MTEILGIFRSVSEGKDMEISYIYIQSSDLE